MNRSLHPEHSAGTRGPATGTLRLLATTDLHGHMLSHDYIKDRPAPGTGLAGIATLIDAARAEARADNAACLLVDNGDIFQGTPLAEHLAARPVTRNHAIAASMAALNYDAIGIGNHDFDYGLDYLRAVTAHLGAPVVCSNLHDVPLDPICDHALICCDLPSRDGTQSHPLKVGVLSVLPTLTTVWNRHALGPQARVEPPVDCVARGVARLRQNGAGLIVVLAHMGMGDHEDIEAAQTGALALQRIPGVDVLITGHTHRRLPGTDYAGREGIDAATGRVGRLPALMAGHAGSDLGVLDLVLEQRLDGAWTVLRHSGSLRPNTAAVAAHPAILRRATAAHDITRSTMSERVATTPATLHSYFALVTPAATTRLVAAAQAHCARRALEGTTFADLPLVAAAAAQTAGGREGPDHYLHIPPGPVLRRHIAGLSPYTDTVVAVLTTGQDLRNRLELTARIFNRIAPDRPEQRLIDRGVPGYQFDALFGISYQIDPTAPFGARIRDLRWQDRPVTADQRFVLATNQFRAAGGGGYAPSPPESIVAQPGSSISETLIDLLRTPAFEMADALPSWRLIPGSGLQATFETAPDAEDHLDTIADLSPEPCGATDDGFLRIRITL